MSTTGELVCLGGLLVAIFIASNWRRLVEPPRYRGEPDPVQGLRGFLAMGVFLQHALIWRHYTQHEGWHEVRYFEQFGEGRVILFFMLSAFLFYGRLVDARNGRKSFDWLRLAVSRFLRLAPAYWLAMLLMFVVVAIAFRWQVDGAGSEALHTSWSDIVTQSTAWMGFAMLGMPAIANYFPTPIVTAGMAWTMPYEITFYLLLPLLALPLRVRMPAVALAVGLAAAMWLAAWSPAVGLCTPYLGGMAAAVLVRVPGVAERLRGRAASVVVLAVMAASFGLFDTNYGVLPMALLMSTVVIVGAGNDMFGVLRSRALQRLGAMAYSLYVLHGIGLYVMFMFVLGEERSAALGPWAFALVVAVTVAAVVAACMASRRWIELPPMRRVAALTARLRGLAAPAAGTGVAAAAHERAPALKSD